MPNTVKDRFEELFHFLDSDPTKYQECANEMVKIYRALKQQNSELTETNKRLINKVSEVTGMKYLGGNY